MKHPNRLRVARAELQVSQLDTATEAEIERSRYWRIEKGYDVPTPEEREALARVLKTDESALFPAPVAL